MTKVKTIVLIFLVALIGILIYFYHAGEQRNLPSFYQWTKEDPLFYSPDMDINAVANQVSTIEADQRKYLSSLGSKEHLYPTDFLNSFIKTASQTAKFLKDPSLENARTLISYQRDTANLYNKEAAGLLVSMQDQAPNISPAVAFNIRKSMQTSVSDLGKLEDNSSILLEEIKKREDCLNSTGNCSLPNSNFKKPSVNTVSQPSNPPSLLSKRLIFSVPGFDASSIKGPYATQTPCFGFNKDLTLPEQYFYVNEDTNQSLIVELATDVFFRKVVTDSPAPAEKKLADAGLKYVRTLSSTPYSCNNESYIPQVYQMDLFLKSNKPILSNISSSGKLDITSLSNAKEFEKGFFDSKYPKYEDSQILAEHYGYIYRLISSDAVLSVKLASLKDELLRRKIILEAKLGALDKVLKYTDDFIKVDSSLQPGRNQTDTAFKKFAYAYKNYYGILYLPFSPSVYRNGNSLDYVDQVYVENVFTLDGPYMDYIQAKTKYSQSEILKWFFPRDKAIGQ